MSGMLACQLRWPLLLKLGKKGELFFKNHLVSSYQASCNQLPTKMTLTDRFSLTYDFMVVLLKILIVGKYQANWSETLVEFCSVPLLIKPMLSCYPGNLWFIIYYVVWITNIVITTICVMIYYYLIMRSLSATTS